MSAEVEFFSAISSAATVTALVGARIYPDVAQQESVLPLIVFERTATEPVTTIHDGFPVAAKVTLSMSVWATTRLVAEEIADATVLALRQHAIVVNRFGHFDDETGAHAAVIEFEIWET